MASGSALHSSLKTRAARVSARVVFQHGHGALLDDRAGVVVVIGEVDRAAADLHARLDHRLVDLRAIIALAAEGGDQRGVDVDHAALIIGRNVEQGQEAGQDDQVGLAVADRVEDRGAELGPSTRAL